LGGGRRGAGDNRRPHFGSRGGGRWRCGDVRRLRRRRDGLRRSGFGRLDFGDGLSAKLDLLALRFIDGAAGLGLTRGGFRGGFQSALAGGEFALRQI
jgi:hypothetical protein